MIIKVCIISEILLLLIWYIYCYFHCRHTAILIVSAEIIIPLIYVIYSVVSPVFFVIEGKSLADRFFYISYDTMEKTCVIYLIVFIILLLMLFFSNTGKILKQRDIDWSGDYRYDMPSIIWDFFAIGVILYYVMRIASYGSGWEQLGTLEKREYISSEYISYLNIYMVAYTNKMLVTWMINKKVRSFYSTLRLIIPIAFWAIYLSVTARRYFLLVFPVIVLAGVASERKAKIPKKWIYISIAAISSLLVMGAKRAFLSLTKGTVIYYLHNTFAEFIYTFYVSCFFVGQDYELQYGKTYIWETMTQWVPRALYPDKHLDLSYRFWKMANTNVAFSFNPVAEGLYNFGIGAIIIVPLVLFLYIKIANYSNKYSCLLYMTIVGSFIGFMRGNLSNCLMDTVMIIIFFLLMNYRGGTYKLYVSNKKW